MLMLLARGLLDRLQACARLQVSRACQAVMHNGIEGRLPVKLIIDDEQQGIKCWSDGGFGATVQIKCSASRTGTEVLAKLAEFLDEFAKKEAAMRTKPSSFNKREVVRLEFEGETMADGTLKSYGIKEGEKQVRKLGGRNTTPPYLHHHPTPTQRRSRSSKRALRAKRACVASAAVCRMVHG